MPDWLIWILLVAGILVSMYAFAYGLLICMGEDPNQPARIRRDR